MGAGCLSPRLIAIFLTTFHTTFTHTKANVPRFSWRVKGHDCVIQYFTGTAHSAHSLNVFFYVNSEELCPVKNTGNSLLFSLISWIKFFHEIQEK